jgi:hypothetical protein
MSSRHATRPQDLGPERLKPDKGAPILDPSVEAEGRTDLCTGDPPREVIRARLLAWLAEGAREVTLALCWLPQQRWAETPPRELGDLPVLEHVRAMAARQTEILSSVCEALGEKPPVVSAASHEAGAPGEWLAEARFELLQRLEQAPDDVWAALEWTLLSARQHELQHLAQIWNIALNWHRPSLDQARTPGVPLHPADRLEESH